MSKSDDLDYDTGYDDGYHRRARADRNTDPADAQRYRQGYTDGAADALLGNPPR